MSTDEFVMDIEPRGFDSGYGGPFKVLSIANYFQEAGNLDATRRGFGMAALGAAGQTWMISKIYFQIGDLPHKGEKLRVRTWPSGCEHLYSLRDAVLESAEGRPLIRAVYGYIIVDIAARRPLRPDRVLSAEAQGAVGAHCVESYSFGTSALSEETELYRLVARPRHIDENGHVNNGHIIDWLVDAAAGKLAGPPSVLKIDFIQEVLTGDELAVMAGKAAAEGAALGTELRRGPAAVARAEFLLG